jgi:hypothetical protein
MADPSTSTDSFIAGAKTAMVDAPRAGVAADGQGKGKPDTFPDGALRLAGTLDGTEAVAALQTLIRRLYPSRRIDAATLAGETLTLHGRWQRSAAPDAGGRG